jgi:hypothetical protein
MLFTLTRPFSKDTASFGCLIDTMTPFTTADYLAMQQRLAPKHRQAVPGDAVELESKLAEFVRTECLRRGWCEFYSRTDKRTGRVPGEPDRLIFCEYPKVILMELKARNEKPKPAQVAIHAWLRKLGWEPRLFVCRSEAEVLEAMK